MPEHYEAMRVDVERERAEALRVRVRIEVGKATAAFNAQPTSRSRRQLLTPARAWVWGSVAAAVAVAAVVLLHDDAPDTIGPAETSVVTTLPNPVATAAPRTPTTTESTPAPAGDIEFELTSAPIGIRRVASGAMLAVSEEAGTTLLGGSPLQPLVDVAVTAVAVSLDGSVLFDGTATWDVQSGARLADVPPWSNESGDGPRDEMLTTDGSRLVLPIDDGDAVMVVDTATGDVIATIADGADGAILSAGFEASDQRVVTATESATEIWDATSGQLVGSLADGFGTLTPDRTAILTWWDRTIPRTAEASTGRRHMAGEPPADTDRTPPPWFAVSDDGKMVLAEGSGGTWIPYVSPNEWFGRLGETPDARRDRILIRQNPIPAAAQVDLTTAAGRVALVSADPSIGVVPVGDLSELTFGANPHISDVVLAAWFGERLVVVRGDGTLDAVATPFGADEPPSTAFAPLIDLDPSVQPPTLVAEVPVDLTWAVGFSADGELVASRDRQTDLVALRDSTTLGVVETLACPLPGAPLDPYWTASTLSAVDDPALCGVTVDPAGTRAATDRHHEFAFPGEPRRTTVWDPVTGVEVARIDGGFGGFSGDGSLFATTGLDGQASVWRASDGTLVDSRQGSATFLPDGRLVLNDGVQASVWVSPSDGTFDIGSPDSSLPFSYAGPFVAITDDGARAVIGCDVVDLESFVIIAMLTRCDWIGAMPADTELVVVQGLEPPVNGELAAQGVYDYERGTFRAVFDGYYVFLDISPDGNRVVVMSAGETDASLQVWQL